MFVLRRSTMEDVEAAVQIANEAKALLKRKGIAQWQRGTYPDWHVFAKDVEVGIGYVVEEVSDDVREVVAVCAVTFTEEESYNHLLTGKWLTEDGTCYATIHRSAVARAKQGRGISTFLFEAVGKMAKEYPAKSIRIDTHPDNLTMQGALGKAGFIKCNEFLLLDGDEVGDLRYGYELVLTS